MSTFLRNNTYRLFELLASMLQKLSYFISSKLAYHIEIVKEYCNLSEKVYSYITPCKTGRGGLFKTLNSGKTIQLLVVVTGLGAIPSSPCLSHKEDGLKNQSLPQLKNQTKLSLLERYRLSKGEQRVEASLGDFVKLPKYKALKKVKVVGKARALPDSTGSQLGQVVWSEVTAKVKGKEQTQVIEKPLTSSFKTKSPSLEQGSEIPAQGDIEALIEAANKLLSGEKTTTTGVIEAPKVLASNERRVDDLARSKGKRKKGGNGSDHSKQGLDGHDRSRDVSYLSDSSHDPLSSHGSPSGRETSSEGSASNTKGTAGIGAFSGSKGSRGGMGQFQTSSSQRHPRDKSLHSKAGHPSSLGHSGHLSGYGVGTSPLFGTLVRGESSLSYPMKPPSEGRGLLPGNSIGVGGYEGLKGRFSEPQPVEEELAKLEPIEVILTKEGCAPRIAFAHSRVIVRTRTITKQGSKVTEGECKDSLENYPIKKDYRCEDCTDIVDQRNRVAYARFRYYWIDGEGRRQEISERIETDEEHPFKFHEEQALCKPKVDLGERLAFRQGETVYYNRFRERIKVAECHPLEGVDPALIILTTQGCTPTHDFEARTSKERARAVFQFDSAQHEALPCHEVGKILPHEFVTSVCQPVHDLSRRLVTLMARRRIQTSQGPLFITEECEPYGESVALKSTSEGCGGEFIHDFDQGKSYTLKRWYYDNKGHPAFVTECLRSEDFFAHQIEITDYQHFDDRKFSKPVTAIFIQPQSSPKIEISPPQVRKGAVDVPYVLVKQETRPKLDAAVYDGCYKITPTDKVDIYRRGGGSLKEFVIGRGTAIRGGDECVRVTEASDTYDYYCAGYSRIYESHSAHLNRHIPHQVVSSLEEARKWWNALSGGDRESCRVLRRTYRKTRTKITYPSGGITYTDWGTNTLIEGWASGARISF